ncbi:hypothetical protein BH23ACT6_BH23ACT6_09760 [soil metagenome]
MSDDRGTFGIPHHTDTSMVWLNTQALSQTGVDRITDRPEQAYAWDEFARGARAVQRAGPSQRAAGDLRLRRRLRRSSAGLRHRPERGGLRCGDADNGNRDPPAATGCGLDSVIVASGVSGEAVGLAVSRFADTSGPYTSTPDTSALDGAAPDSDTTGRSAADAVWQTGSPDALAQGTVGLLVRDPIYSVTGLALGSDVPASTESGWIDRAGLMEVSWEADVPGLAGDFFAPPPRDDGNLAAALVLGSTATATGCRVLVSHVRTTGATVGDCAGPHAPAVYSLDFATSFMGRSGTDGDHCVARLNPATAAMLAARFPYVTPSGVVGPCGGAPRAQLIDGGYAEGSGVGSLVDLGAPLLEEVREFNEAASADAGSGDGSGDNGSGSNGSGNNGAGSGGGGGNRDVIVPILVYLDNGRGSDLVQPPPSAVAELLVPPVGAMRGRSSQQSTTALLQPVFLAPWHYNCRPRCRFTFGPVFLAPWHHNCRPGGAGC